MFHLPEYKVPFLKDTDSHRLMAQYPNLPATPDHCPTCNGKKTFQWFRYDALDTHDPQQPQGGGEDVVEFECACDNQWMLNRYLFHCGIGMQYQRMSWRDRAIPIPEPIQDYTTNYEPYIRNGLGITLYGTMGTGKTLFINLLLKYLIRKGYDGYFTTFADLLEKFRSGFVSQEEKAWFYKRIRNARILIIDDIGREQQMTVFRAKDATNQVVDDRDYKSNASVVHVATAIAESTLDEIVRHRVNQSMPTFVTTNLDRTQLQNKYGGNVLSLLTESNQFFKFESADFRNIAEERKRNEIRQGLTRPIVL